MSLSREQLEEYREDGFLLVPDLFRPAELAPVIAELDELVDGIAAILHERGHIADTHADKGFTTRLAALNRDFPGAGVLANLRGKFGPALAELWRSHQLLDIVEQLIGRDIDGHANWVLRSKTPETSRLTVPWHQDAAYFTPDAEATFIPTIWIPLVDATRENGALQFLRGAHNPPRIYHHDIESQTTANRDSWYLIMDGADVAAEEIVTCEAPLGSVILHSNLIPHRSTENHTDAVRWAVDLRWHAPGTPPGINIPSVPMRRVDEPGLKPDFKVWAGEFEEKWHERNSRANSEELELTVDGTWLARWEAEPKAGPRFMDRGALRGVLEGAYV